MTMAGDDAAWVTGDAVILDEIGLHARPAVKVAKLAKTFAATVEIRPDGHNGWINAKSPNAVMKLRAAHGARLLIRASGNDASTAVGQLVALVERNFDA